MLRLLLKRILSSVPTLFIVTLVAFGLIRMVEGDPVLLLLGERGGSPELVQEMRANLGLDKSLIEQYSIFLTRAMQGDLGKSIISNRPVLEEFWDRFPATLELGLVAMMFAVFVGIPMGLIAAVKRNTWIDYFFMGGSLVGYSMPIFWWGLILIVIFSVSLGLTPVAGRMSVMFDVPPRTGFMLLDSLVSEDGFAAFRAALSHLILPSVALGTIPLAAIARMTRSSLLEVLREDYIRTAQAKGLSGKTVVVHHALRNALIPIVTVTGLMLGTILTGAVLTETIFSWPGIGKWLVHSVQARDYPVIQGGILLISLLIIIVNITVDVLYLWINPVLRESVHG